MDTDFILDVKKNYDFWNRHGGVGYVLTYIHSCIVSAREDGFVTSEYT
jgi:hypothetical protein